MLKDTHIHKNSIFQSRSCPNCGSSKANLEVRSLISVDSLDVEDLRKHWAGFFKRKGFFDYGRCQFCGLLYAPVYFRQEYLEHLYGYAADNTAGIALQLMKKTQRKYFEFWQQYSKNKAGVFLEFGPDIGLFTEYCAKQTHFSFFWFIEPNKSVHSLLAKAVFPKQYKIENHFINLSAIPNASVDAAAMIHVLDHMIDPKNSLIELRQKLKPGSSILIVTHDERSFLAKLLGPAWPPYCLQHPQLFNVKSTRQLLEHCGYKVIRTHKSYNYFPMTYLAQHLVYALGLGKIWLPEWNGLSFPIKLGNIMTVAELV